MFTTGDSLIVLCIQNLKQTAVLNPIFIDISTTEPFNNFIQKYPPEKFISRFRLTSITTSTSMRNLNNTILIMCVRLNQCKKADVNGKEVNVLGVIHTRNINNWEQLRETSSWINIDLADYLNAQEASNLSFRFLTKSIYSISKSIYPPRSVLSCLRKLGFPNKLARSTSKILGHTSMTCSFYIWLA